MAIVGGCAVQFDALARVELLSRSLGHERDRGFEVLPRDYQMKVSMIAPDIVLLCFVACKTSNTVVPSASCTANCMARLTNQGGRQEGLPDRRRRAINQGDPRVRPPVPPVGRAQCLLLLRVDRLVHCQGDRRAVHVGGRTNQVIISDPLKIRPVLRRRR